MGMPAHVEEPVISWNVLNRGGCSRHAGRVEKYAKETVKLKIETKECLAVGPCSSKEAERAWR